MKIIERMTAEQIRVHLKEQSCAFDFGSFVGNFEEEFDFVKARFEASDIERIYLYFEFKKYSFNQESNKLTDMLYDSAIQQPRIRRPALGDDEKKLPPTDLRFFAGHPTLVSNDLTNGPLLGIDGNHRMVAQYITGRDFENVPAVICSHPSILKWPYFIGARDWWNSRKQ